MSGSGAQQIKRRQARAETKVRDEARRDECLIELSKFPFGTAALSFGPLTAGRLFACKLRGLADQDGSRDNLGELVWRVTDGGRARVSVLLALAVSA